MAKDITLTDGAPGIASFATETYGNTEEVRFGDTPYTTTTVNATGVLNLALYSVVSYDGTTIALADETVAGDAYGVLTAPVVLAAGETTTVDLIRTGHLSMDALVWDASFDTDAKKKVAFEAGLSPTLFVSKKKFNSDGVAV